MPHSVSAGYQHLRRSLSLLARVVVNLVPLAGVLLWECDVGALVVLYWSENLIHYGGFCAVHGIFVQLLGSVVLHMAILFGGAGLALGSPVPLLILLVCLQVPLDVVLHLREHQPSEAA